MTAPFRPPKKYEDQIKINDQFKVDLDQRTCDKRCKQRAENALRFRYRHKRRDLTGKKELGRRPNSRTSEKDKQVEDDALEINNPASLEYSDALQISQP